MWRTLKNFFLGSGTATRFEKPPQSEQVSEYCRIEDPFMEATLRRIFSFGNPVNDVTGQERIMSLLNSLLYPTAGDEGQKVREVLPLPDKVSRLCVAIGLDLSEIVVVCRCSCWEVAHPDYKNIFDIGIRMGSGVGFSEMLFECGMRMRRAGEYRSVVMLGFLNPVCDGESGSSWRGLCSLDMGTGSPLGAFTPRIDSYCVDLYEQAMNLRSDSPIAIAGKELGIIGREWLKLLTLRFWAMKDGLKYLVPKGFGSDDEINSAFLVLADGATEPGIRQEKIEAVKRVLTKSACIEWNHEQIAEAVGLSVGELMELMNSAEFVLSNPKPHAFGQFK
jgi:hypothetical protein